MSEIVDLELSEHGQRCVAALQEVIAEFNLTPSDAVMSAGEVFAWVHLLGFMSVGKERMLMQFDRSAAACREYIEREFEAYRARMEVVAALDRDESGGRLQ